MAVRTHERRMTPPGLFLVFVAFNSVVIDTLSVLTPRILFH
jgi:hypothetical protein